MGYKVEGRILEVCTCEILCPCWVGENPDGETCDSVVAYHVDKGTIEGVDVSGRTLAIAAHIPGNVFAGNWQVMLFVDDKATPEQEKALAQCFSGEMGGPLEEYAQLIGRVIGVDRAPIAFEVVEGKGRLTVGKVIDAELEPYRGPTGEPTKLVESAFSTIPGSPAYVGKASKFKRRGIPDLKDVDISGYNAIQGHFAFEAA